MIFAGKSTVESISQWLGDPAPMTPLSSSWPPGVTLFVPCPFDGRAARSLQLREPWLELLQRNQRDAWGELWRIHRGPFWHVLALILVGIWACLTSWLLKGDSQHYSILIVYIILIHIIYVDQPAAHIMQFIYYIYRDYINSYSKELHESRPTAEPPL